MSERDTEGQSVKFNANEEAPEEPRQAQSDQQDTSGQWYAKGAAAEPDEAFRGAVAEDTEAHMPERDARPGARNEDEADEDSEGQYNPA